MTPERIRELWDRNPDCMRFAQAVALEAQRDEILATFEREVSAFSAENDALLRRLDEWGTVKRLEYLPSLGREAAARVRELEADRDSWRDRCVRRRKWFTTAINVRDAEDQRTIDVLKAERDAMRVLLREAQACLGDNDHEDSIVRRIDATLAGVRP